MMLMQIMETICLIHLISVSSLTGIKNGVRNDDSFNRIYYFDLNASDQKVLTCLITLEVYADDDRVGVIDFSSLQLER